MLSLTAADDGRTVALRMGEKIRISLPENAGGGYRWDIDRADGGIEASGSQPHYSGEAVGSGGLMTFIFAAKKPGKGEIVLKNWRAFEGDTSVQQRFRLTVDVEA